MLLSKAREGDIVGNAMPENMAAAEKRLEVLSETTIRDAESRDWGECESGEIQSRHNVETGKFQKCFE